MRKLAPGHLSQETKKFWKEIIREYAISDSAGLKILLAACEAMDRASACRKQIDLEGLSIKDKFGQTKAHPLLASERDARAQFLAATKALNLDLEPLRDRPGRPAGR